jgi:actin-related protein
MCTTLASSASSSLGNNIKENNESIEDSILNLENIVNKQKEKEKEKEEEEKEKEKEKEEEEKEKEKEIEEEEKEKEKEKEIEPVIEYTSKISCIYEIIDTENSTKIFSDVFNAEDPNLKLLINSVEIPFTKEFNFSNSGPNTIELQITDKINLDYIFENIETITSLKLEPISPSNIIQIASMRNSFQNCRKLTEVTITNAKILNDDLSYLFYSLPELK